MKKNTHKKILSFGCAVGILSLAGIQTLPVKATGSSEKSFSSNGITKIQTEMFMPSSKTEVSGGTFWYKCVIPNNSGERVYYKSKKSISKNINDLIRELKEDKEFFSTEIKSKKEIEKICSLFEVEPEGSVEEEFSEESADEIEIKTPEEFKNLSKIEKSEYLTNPHSDLALKMRCHPLGSNLFNYNTSQFQTLLNSRFENYFKKFFSTNHIDPKKIENKKPYRELTEYLVFLSKAIEKFMDDHELCEIYRRIYNILK